MFDIETIDRNNPNREFINFRDVDDNLDDEMEFQDESESDDKYKDDKSYYESDIK